MVTFNSRKGSAWMGRVVKSEDESVLLGITPTAEAIVGKFRTYVAVVATGGMQRTKRNPGTDLYVLFNAWCPGQPISFSLTERFWFFWLGFHNRDESMKRFYMELIR